MTTTQAPTPAPLTHVPKSLALGFLVGANMWPLLAHPTWAPHWFTVAVAIFTVAAGYRLGSSRHA